MLSRTSASRMETGAALVTTAWLRDATRGSRHVDVLNAFLLYHVSIGVDCIFVFFDGDATQQPTEAVMDRRVQELLRSQRIEFFYRNDSDEMVCSSATGESLAYAQCRNYAALQSTMAGDVSSRQLLHAEMAMRRCVSINKSTTTTPLTWLLHLDIDELLLCEEATSESSTQPLQRLLSSLASRQVDQLTIVNYEGVPTARRGGNYFLTTSKFRRHTARIPLSPASRDALDVWQRRSLYRQYFLFYDNGKSIVRIPQDGNEEDAPLPASVHHWKPRNPGAWRSVSNFFDPRRNDQAVVKTLPPVSVLHYPVSGLDWLTDKYERLGDFASVWGGTSIAIQPCFHLQARDAWASSEPAKAMLALYESHVMVSAADTAFWRQQLDAGVCEEITFPRLLLLALGFHEDSMTVEANGESDTIAAPTDSTTPSTKTAFSVEKAWMLAAISDQYL